MSKPREFWITYQPYFNYFEASTEKTEDFDYHVIEKHHADQLADALEKLKKLRDRNFYPDERPNVDEWTACFIDCEQALKNYQEGE